jgi:hypothetical protein
VCPIVPHVRQTIGNPEKEKQNAPKKLEILESFILLRKNKYENIPISIGSSIISMVQAVGNEKRKNITFIGYHAPD